MGVVDQYVTASVEAGTRTLAVNARGVKVLHAQATFETVAADSDGSVYRLLKGIPTSTILRDIKIFNDAITAGSDWDLGFYQTQQPDGSDGAVINANVLVDGADLSSAHSVAAPLSGMTNVDLPNHGKTIRELLGLTIATDHYNVVDLALTANTVGSGVGTILVKVDMVSHGS